MTMSPAGGAREDPAPSTTANSHETAVVVPSSDLIGQEEETQLKKDDRHSNSSEPQHRESGSRSMSSHPQIEEGSVPVGNGSTDTIEGDAGNQG